MSSSLKSTLSSTTSSHQSSRSKSKKKDESKSSKSQDEKTTEETTTTTSTPPSSVSSVLNLLEDFDNSEDALDSIDPISLAVLVNAVRTLVSDNMQHLVTEQSVVSSFFPDDDYHADLFPYRRRLRDPNPNFFGLSPDGCRGATSSMISKVLMIVFLFAGVDNSAEVSQRVTQEYVMLESHDSLMSEIFEVYDSSLFAGSSIDTVKAGMSIWWQLWRYFGLKELYSVVKSSSKTPDDLEVTYLVMVALSVTNGAPLMEDMGPIVTSAVDELTNEGVDWINTCFITSCDGDSPICDDGNKCTLNRNRCNSNTEWAWECTHHAKICSPGYSCDPSDGDCKPDDVLVPCVAVIDEDDGFGSPNQVELWNQFRSRFPARPFCLLVPSSSTSNTVTPPDSFLTDDLTIVHYDVVRDNDDVSLAMDWVSMCGLNLYTNTNVQWVGLFIDDSGSMRESNVAASRDEFYTRLEQQGIEVKKVVNPNENWILPFLETLVPEEENSVYLNQYVFWPSFDSEGFDIIQHSSLSISALAGICNSNVDCLGFNSNGWLKSQIKPLDQWVELALDRKEDKGVYIKKPESYSIEQGRRLSSASGRGLFKRPLSEEEIEWLNYITKYTILYHPLPRYEAILQIAWGTLWSLKTGALNGNLWRSNSDYTPVDNPFLHTLCNEAFFDPFEVCTANDWSVGIALNDPKDYTLSELEADASYYYPDVDTASSVSKALKRTIRPGACYLNYKGSNEVLGITSEGKQGCFLNNNEFNNMYDKILANEDLTKSWLLRNHFIGLSNRSKKAQSYCESDPNPEPWCAAIDDVKVLLQSMVGGDCPQDDGYVFWPSYDSDSENIGEQLSAFPALIATCNSNPDCKGFTTEGFLKKSILPLDQWDNISRGGGECSGLYIKKPDEYIINGNERTSLERKWLDFIVKYSIPNLQDFHFFAIQRVAWGTLWSLYKGVLMRENPFIYNVCNDANQEITIDGSCPSNDWRFGVAAAEINEHQLVDLVDDTEKYYGSVELAITQSIKQAGLVPTESALASILDNERLTTAWLLRNHLIGLTHQGNIVKARCSANPQLEDCILLNQIFNDGDVLGLFQSLVGGVCKPLQISGYDFHSTKDSSDGDMKRPNGDIYRLTTSSIVALWDECNKLPNCKGFNTNGFLKEELQPEFTAFSIAPSPCQGLYVKQIEQPIKAVLDKARDEYAKGIWADKSPNVNSKGEIKKYYKHALGVNGRCGPGDRTNPEQWCADFVSWVFNEAGHPIYYDGIGQKEAGHPIYYEGLGECGAPQIRKWLIATQKWIPLKSGTPLGSVAKPGDLVLFGTSIDWPAHIGIVEKVRDDGTLDTIEGNTPDPTGARPNTGVYRKHRTGFNYDKYGRTGSNGKDIVGFGRVFGEQSPQQTPSTTQKLQIKKGELTIKGEAKILAVYWPEKLKSGVTLGIGYDIGGRPKDSVKSELVSAGMNEEQATKISNGAGLTGETQPTAKEWVDQNKDDIGAIDESVVNTLFARISWPQKGTNAKWLATTTQPFKGATARDREIIDGKELYTYVMKEQQWNNLHPAMIEFLTDLKFHGSFYTAERVAAINEFLIIYDGDHLRQFEHVAALFGSPPPPDGVLSFMDDHAINDVGLSPIHPLKDKEEFFGIKKEDAKGATERRERIRLSFLLRVIYALRAGLTVEMVPW